MLLIVFVAIAGGLLTAAAMVPYGPLIALLGAPFGGSLCAAVAALVILQLRGPAYRSDEDLDARTDAMVADLQGILAQARRQEPSLRQESSRHQEPSRPESERASRLA